MDNSEQDLDIWSSEEASLPERKRRLGRAQSTRRWLERRWDENEITVYGTKLAGLAGWGAAGVTSAAGDETEAGVAVGPDMAAHRTFRNFRYIHAQLSSNPPSVVPRPSTMDQEDRRRADAADRGCRYALRKYCLQERQDQTSLMTLLYGLGATKTIQDPARGRIIGVDRRTGKVKTEGDFQVCVPHTRNLFIDPDAQSLDEIRYIWERIILPFEEAVRRWPDKRELLESLKGKISFGQRLLGGFLDWASGATYGLEGNGVDSDLVVVYEYWETGLPANAYAGRHFTQTEAGDLLTEIGPSPHAFVPSGLVTQAKRDRPGRRVPKFPRIARLPYHIFTDVDVPGTVWGKSVVEYTALLQDRLNRIDTLHLSNIQAAGAIKMILPETAGIEDDALSDVPLEAVKITGNQPPYFMEAPGNPPLVTDFRDRLDAGIDLLWGMNENMLGQQSREQSAASMQYATNNGNMIRRRLFNKYVSYVESMYKALLDLMRLHWTTPRLISVLGEEKAFESVDFQGSDIDGGYDLVVEYGASLSLDPLTRREELIRLQPMFKEAGISSAVTLRMMKLNELDGMYDLVQMAEDRQREIFEEMIATGKYVRPRKYENHPGMIEWARIYTMTSEFKYLSESEKQLIEQHISEREQMGAAPVPVSSTEQALPTTGFGTPGAPPAAVPAAPAPTAAPVAAAAPAVAPLPPIPQQQG